MSKPTRSSAVPGFATAAILAAGFAGAVAINWPGHLSYDPVLQLLQGRSGVYNTWHPPVMAWLLGLFDAIQPGAGLFVMFDAALAFGALASLAWRGRRLGVAAALVIVLLPQLWLYQGVVWKDVLFADAAVAGFAGLAQAAARWEAPGSRAAWIGASFVLLSLAALTRQNGAAVLPFAAAALGWIASKRGASPRLAAALGGGFFVGLLAFTAGANGLLDLRSNGDSGAAEQLRLLEAYDLSGAVAREPGLSLARLDDDALEAAIRGSGARRYTPVRNDPISSAPDIGATLANADDDALAAQWRELIVRHTRLYLQLRSAAFGWVFATPDIAACRPVFVGIEGPARELRHLGIAPRRDARDLVLERTARAFMGTPVFSHPAFALLALGCLVVLLRRRRPADIAVAAMLAGAFAFTATFFAISIACDYRYLYVLDLSALAALLYLASGRRDAA